MSTFKYKCDNYNLLESLEIATITGIWSYTGQQADMMVALAEVPPWKIKFIVYIISFPKNLNIHL